MLSGRALARWLRREIWGSTKQPQKEDNCPTPLDNCPTPLNNCSVARKPPRREQRGSARNYRYRAWIRSLPCAVCGITPTHAAHTGPHAVGQKSSDYTCIPLCGDHHMYAGDALHRIGRRDFEQRFDLDIGALVRRLNWLWWNQWKAGNE